MPRVHNFTTGAMVGKPGKAINKPKKIDPKKAMKDEAEAAKICSDPKTVAEIYAAATDVAQAHEEKQILGRYPMGDGPVSVAKIYEELFTSDDEKDRANAADILAMMKDKKYQASIAEFDDLMLEAYAQGQEGQEFGQVVEMIMKM